MKDAIIEDLVSSVVVGHSLGLFTQHEASTILRNKNVQDWFQTHPHGLEILIQKAKEIIYGDH